jgi:hypothetical protein
MFALKVIRNTCKYYKQKKNIDPDAPVFQSRVIYIPEGETAMLTFVAKDGYAFVLELGIWINCVPDHDHSLKKEEKILEHRLLELRDGKSKKLLLNEPEENEILFTHEIDEELNAVLL